MPFLTLAWSSISGSDASRARPPSGGWPPIWTSRRESWPADHGPAASAAARGPPLQLAERVAQPMPDLGLRDLRQRLGGGGRRGGRRRCRDRLGGRSGLEGVRLRAMGGLDQLAEFVDGRKRRSGGLTLRAQQRRGGLPGPLPVR